MKLYLLLNYSRVHGHSRHWYVCTLITKLYYFMKVIKNYITHAVEVNVLVSIEDV